MVLFTGRTKGLLAPRLPRYFREAVLAMTQAISASKQASNSNPETPLPARWNIKQRLPWLLSWEIYLVLVIAGFLRRYYGPLAGITAALLYAAAAKPLNYSRFIWQQNMLAPLVVLFMFALFCGVVERRKGWFFPAVFLLGMAYQLH